MAYGTVNTPNGHHEYSQEPDVWKRAPILKGTTQFEPRPGVRNIMVTGGAGFIASWVVRHLTLTYPQAYNIVSFDKLDYCSSLNNTRALNDKRNFTFYHGDLTNPPEVLDCMERHQIDTVLNFAAQSHVDLSFGNSYSFTHANVYGTHVLLESAKKACVNRFIHVSTDEVYGEVKEGDDELHESSILAPTNPYAASKAAAEMLVHSYYKSFKLPIITVRSNNVYGPHQYPEKIIPKFACLLGRGRPVVLHGDGRPTRRYLYAGDAADAFDTILHKGQVGHVYNVGSSDEVSNLELSHKILDAMNIDPDNPNRFRRWIKYTKDRPFNDLRYAVDGTKLRKLGWEQKTSFQEGLQMTIDWYQQFGELWWGDISHVLTPFPTVNQGEVMPDDDHSMKDEPPLPGDECHTTVKKSDAGPNDSVRAPQAVPGDGPDMAQKRRLSEQQDGARKSAAMSPHEPPFNSFHPVSRARLSSDGSPSEEGAPSDGAHTAMTSMVDTDEDPLADAGHDEVPVLYSYEQFDDDDDRAPPAMSTYAASHWPRPSSTHGTAMQLYTEDGHTDVAASTRSLWVPDLDYREIHGRRYAREYYMPNDEIEQLRLSIQHQVFLHLLDGELTCVPLDDPSHILDVGTGPGEWAIRMAELFPDCEVVGTDISAVAETERVPQNVFFEIEDAEEWDRAADHYDLIHFWCLEGAFRDWRSIYDNAYDSLKPGGWIELVDFDSIESVHLWFRVFSEGSPIFDMARDLEIAAERVGKKRGISHMDPQLLMEAGFVDVRVTEHSIPMKISEKSAGKLWLISCLDGLEANCLRLLTQVMGWDPDKCKAACEQAARELAQLAKDPEKATGLRVKALTVSARKPLEAHSPGRWPSASPPALEPDEEPVASTWPNGHDVANPPNGSMNGSINGNNLL
ncbi:protein phosphatase PP2A regulatory subunit A [Purpureocillium lavendulum]|uniref:Protein phosphatase PP2A regulatory subunit A n=1 Tax=Purpureocillium lavendulum TaxID=1247861 RepID=A0AB34FZY1_9HYPO|nr:protein phosphatase PP2A regulatory subunit A [Purpureocillium lavendulum]